MLTYLHIEVQRSVEVKGFMKYYLVEYLINLGGVAQSRTAVATRSKLMPLDDNAFEKSSNFATHNKQR